MRLSIIIPTCRREPFIFKSFEAVVGAAKGLDSEIILVDDNPSERIKLPEHLLPHLTVYPNEGRGLAAGRNTGARHATGEVLLFMDDDILVERQHLIEIMKLQATDMRACFNLNWRYPEELVEHCRHTKFGRFILKEGLINYKSWDPELSWREELFEARRLAGFFMTMPKQIFEEAGGFDPAFPLAGAEDYEMCRRLQKMGVRFFVEPRHFVLHNEIDRIDLINRLNRLKAGTYNRQLALDMGMTEFRQNYSLPQRVIYPLLSMIKQPLLQATMWIPNNPFFDLWYQFLVHRLIGTVIFEANYWRDNSYISSEPRT